DGDRVPAPARRWYGPGGRARPGGVHVLGPDDLVLSAGTVGNPPPDVLLEAATAGGYQGLSAWVPYLVAPEPGTGTPFVQPCGLSPAELRRRCADAGVGIELVEGVGGWVRGPGGLDD